MPELGNRANVMGPQPIAARKPVEPEMTAAVARVMDLVASGKSAELEAMALPKARESVADLARSARPGAYNKNEVLAHARVNAQYFVKCRLSGANIEPFLFQMRVGEHEGRWTIWEVKNLTGRRSAWTK
jgi:hypothetical protein